MRMELLSGHQTRVTLGQHVEYVSGYEPGGEPIRDEQLHGTSLTVHAVVDFWTQTVSLLASAKVTNLREIAEQPGSHAGQAVQLPRADQWYASASADVPDGRTMVLTSNAILPRLTMRDEKSGAATVDVRDVRVIVLVRPTIILPPPVEGRSAP